VLAFRRRRPSFCGLAGNGDAFLNAGAINRMNSVTLSIARRVLLSGACVLLAACGGDEAETSSANAAASADSGAGPSFSAPVGPQVAMPVPSDSAAPAAAAPTAPLPPAAARARDSAMTAAILQAPVTGPVNADVVGEYRLTMDGVRKLVGAGQQLAALQASRPELRDSMALDGFDPNGIYEKLNRYPEVRAAIAESGMTPREYATATAALMQAAMIRQMRARGMQPRVQVNEANVRFVDENWNEIQGILQAAAAQQMQRMQGGRN
jgi:hypothetical protein